MALALCVWHLLATLVAQAVITSEALAASLKKHKQDNQLVVKKHVGIVTLRQAHSVAQKMILRKDKGITLTEAYALRLMQFTTFNAMHFEQCRYVLPYFCFFFFIGSVSFILFRSRFPHFRAQDSQPV